MQFSYDISTDRFSLNSNGRTIKMPHNMDRYEYYRYMPENGTPKEIIREYLANAPHEICFEITNKCNLACPVCIANAGDKNDVFLRPGLIQEKLKELPKHIQRVTITGGETTLHPNLAEIVNLSTSLLGTVLSTNGYCPDQLDNITKENSKNLIIAISLHGPKHIHDNFVGKSGSFDNALKTIDISIKNGAFTHIYTTASEYNIGYLTELSEILKDFNIVEHRINQIKNSGRIKINPVSYTNVLRTISHMRTRHKTTIKNEGQPFLFVSCRGVMEMKNV
ncbi:MAG: radical SAM protein [Desulfobulbaceae bacterium]